MLEHKNRQNSSHGPDNRCIHLAQSKFHWYIQLNRLGYIFAQYEHHVDNLDNKLWFGSTTDLTDNNKKKDTHFKKRMEME